MNWRLTAAVMVAFVVLGGTAQADTLIGGPAYGAASEVGGIVICSIFNGGTQSVTVPYRQIYDQLGNQLALTSDNCNVTLGAGKTCFYEAAIGSPARFLSCRAITNGIDNTVSGTVELFNSTGQFLLSTPMHK